jgi:hypothetical protein
MRVPGTRAMAQGVGVRSRAPAMPGRRPGRKSWRERWVEKGHNNPGGIAGRI